LKAAGGGWAEIYVGFSRISGSGGGGGIRVSRIRSTFIHNTVKGALWCTYILFNKAHADIRISCYTYIQYIKCYTLHMYILYSTE
jgi:hypothetical protein